jgi:hypothetical protein
MSVLMPDHPTIRADEREEGPPLFSTWPRLYVAILLWELVTIALIAAATSWIG